MEIDILIQKKRSELKDAFAAHLKARKAAENMREQISERLLPVGPENATPDWEWLQLAKARQQELDSEEHIAAANFDRVSEELAQLHRQKHGVWHITWIGPRA